MDEQEIAENVNTAPADAETAAAPAAEPDACPASDVTAEPAAEAEKPFEPRVHKPVVPEMLDRTRKDLLKMLDFLGYEDAVVKAAESNGEIELSVESQDAGRIIGRKGQTLESIQLLLNRMVQKDDPEYPRILITIDGYASRFANGRGHSSRTTPEDGEPAPRRERRERREDRPRRERGTRREHRTRDDEGIGGGSQHEENLRQQALDAAKEVRHWGDPKTLPAMNAHDRRIIHITLKDDPEVVTESIGEGAMKKVVISLKKAE